MFERGLKGHLVQPWTLCQTVMGDTEMTQGVSEELSSTADREVQGKDLRPGHPSFLPSEQSNLRQDTFWVLVPFSVNINFQRTET